MVPECRTRLFFQIGIAKSKRPARPSPYCGGITCHPVIGAVSHTTGAHLIRQENDRDRYRNRGRHRFRLRQRYRSGADSDRRWVKSLFSKRGGRVSASRWHERDRSPGRDAALRRRNDSRGRERCCPAARSRRAIPDGSPRSRFPGKSVGGAPGVSGSGARRIRGWCLI